MASAFSREPVIDNKNDRMSRSQQVTTMEAMQDSANQSPRKIRRGRDEVANIEEKKLSILSVRDSEVDLLGLTLDPEDTPSSQSSTSTDGMTNQAAQNDNALKQREDVSSTNPNPEVRPKSRKCCGGHSTAIDENHLKGQLQNQGLLNRNLRITENTIQNIPLHSVEPSTEDCNSSNELSTATSSPGSLADSSTTPKGNVQPNHQGQGLFKILLQDTHEEELVLGGDSKTTERGMTTLD